MSAVETTAADMAQCGRDTGELATSALEFVNCPRGYGRTTVLRDVSFQVAPGQVVALIDLTALARRPYCVPPAGSCTQRRVESGSTAPTDRRAPHQRAARVCA